MFLLLLKRLLEHESVRRLDTFVVLLLTFDDLKAKFLVKLNGNLVVYLHMPSMREGNEDK